MRVDFDKLSGSDTVVSVDDSYEFLDFQGDENSIKCHLDVAIHRIGEIHYLTVDVSGAIDTFCHKCLEPVTQRIETSFDLIVQWGGGNKAEEFESSIEEYIYLPQGQHELSLDNQVYENLIASLPMQILCGEECKGLCMECGVNLNTESCGCVREGDISRSALNKLKNGFNQ
jgi:uncharacterized metal-binding protein YceD (DUF177 family)